MTPEINIDPIIAKRLSSLSKVDPRPQQRAIRTRAAFLTQALEARSILPVSDSPKQRLKMWIQDIQFLSVFKEDRKPLYAAIASAFLVITLVLGGGAITYAAAQNSLPEQPLYRLKIWAEGVQQDMAVGQIPEYELALQFSDRRADEVQHMVDNGQVVDQVFEDLYYQQVDEVIWLAVDQSDDTVPPALSKVREHLMKQVELFTRLLEKAPQAAQGTLQRILARLQERIRECDEGIADPGQLRERLRLIQPQTPPGLIKTKKPKPGDDSVLGPNATATPKATKERPDPQNNKEVTDPASTHRGPDPQSTPTPKGTKQKPGK
jgi:hypothetical protein